MKRLPVVMSFVALVVLSVSLAYWAMQLFTLPQRPLAAAPLQERPAPSLDAAGAVFGGQSTATVVSSYQLKGVVAAANGRGSVAILSYDNKPARALAVGAEVVPGVSVKQVEPRYVLLADGGGIKRIELAVENRQGGAGAVSVAPPRPEIPLPTAAPVTNPDPTVAPVETPSRPNNQQPGQAPPPPPQQQEEQPRPLSPQAPPSGRMGMGTRQLQR